MAEFKRREQEREEQRLREQAEFERKQEERRRREEMEKQQPKTQSRDTSMERKEGEMSIWEKMSHNARKEQEQRAPVVQAVPKELVKKPEVHELTLEEEMARIPDKRNVNAPVVVDDDKQRLRKEEALLFGTPGRISDK